MTAFDLHPHLATIAMRPALSHQTGGAYPYLETARHLYNGGTLLVYAPDSRIDLYLPGIARVDDPDDANVTLVVHRGEARATAAAIEALFTDGRRVALWDSSHEAGRGDLRLMAALLDTTVYIGNLAACDTTLERTLAAVLVPLRSGAAFRRYLTTSILYQWVWADGVREEVERRFGETLNARDLARAIIQVDSRFGAWLTRLGRRGLRERVGQIAFVGGRVDGLQIVLEGEVQKR
jgi:hypothetical protein